MLLLNILLEIWFGCVLCTTLHSILHFLIMSASEWLRLSTLHNVFIIIYWQLIKYFLQQNKSILPYCRISRWRLCGRWSSPGRSRRWSPSCATPCTAPPAPRGAAPHPGTSISTVIYWHYDIYTLSTGTMISTCYPLSAAPGLCWCCRPPARGPAPPPPPPPPPHHHEFTRGV